MPIFERVVLQDDAGVGYAFDLAPTEGFFVVIASYLVLRTVVRYLRAVTSSPRRDD